MAKLGYLFLHNGIWEGRQVVSEAWVQAATRQQAPTEGGLGYGYQWWIDPVQGSYSARGRYGQSIFVFPSLDLIVVTTAASNNEDAIYRLINADILPAVR
jgi:CubicO group peptidase (beta-lactamase class C family)